MKLNKKGFTLIELLAVIAILAILMMLVTPNILNMFTEGKESAFITQAQSIYKAAETQYVKDSLKTPTSKLYTNLSAIASATTSTLDVSGGDVNYCVRIGSSGVTQIVISDGNYSISLGSSSGTEVVSINTISVTSGTDDDYDNLKKSGDDDFVAKNAVSTKCAQ